MQVWKESKEVDSYAHRGWVHCNSLALDGKIATFSVDHTIIIRNNQQSTISSYYIYLFVCVCVCVAYFCIPVFV